MDPLASSPYLGEVELIILSWLFQPHCSKREASLKIMNHAVIFNEIHNIGLIHHIISDHIISHHITSYHIRSYHITSHQIISHHITSYHIIHIYIFYMLILHTSSNGMYWDISMILFKSNSALPVVTWLPTEPSGCEAARPTTCQVCVQIRHGPDNLWYGMTWHGLTLPDICLSEGYLLIWVCLKMWLVPHCTHMVLLIIIPMKNGYFIGNIPYFQTHPYVIFCINQQYFWHLWRCFYVRNPHTIPIALAKNSHFLAVVCLVSCRLVGPDLLQSDYHIDW